jgi:hypothetical protein
MMGSRARCSLLAALSLGCLLAACEDSAPDPQAAGAAATTKAAPKTNELPPNMVAAVSAGKTATAIGVHFSLGASPAVNTALPVDIALVPHETFVSVGAHFQSQDGLTLMSGDELAPTKSAPAEKIIKHQLRLMPARTGVYIVTASVETEGAEGTVTRVFSIPVIVEPPASAKPETAPETPAAEPASAPETPPAN